MFVFRFWYSDENSNESMRTNGSKSRRKLKREDAPPSKYRVRYSDSSNKNQLCLQRGRRSFRFCMCKINTALFICQSARGWSIVRGLEGSNEKLNRAFVGGERPTSFRQIENPMLIAISNRSLRLISISRFRSALPRYLTLTIPIYRPQHRLLSLYIFRQSYPYQNKFAVTVQWISFTGRNLFLIINIERKPLDKLIKSTRKNESLKRTLSGTVIHVTSVKL